MSKLAQPPLDTGAFTETLSAINGQSLNVFTDAFWRGMKNFNAAGTELVRFVNERFDKDLQIASRFAECRWPEDSSRCSRNSSHRSSATMRGRRPD